MPITIIPEGSVYGEYYAVDGQWVDPTSQDELNALTQFIQMHHRNLNLLYATPDDTQATLDWRLLRDTILPVSQDWVNAQFTSRYAVPFRKTRENGTKYDKNIVNLAALTVAEIIENRTFAANAMPAMSEYGKQLLSDRDALLADIKAMRLRGQRLKANERTYDPNMEPVNPPAQGSGRDKANYQPKAPADPSNS